MPAQTNITDVKASFRRYQALLVLAGNESVRTVTPAVRDEAKAEAPVRTGALRDEIDSRVLGGIGEVRSGQRLDYPKFVHGGTRRMTANPYMLRAVRRMKTKAAGMVRPIYKRFIKRASRST